MPTTKRSPARSQAKMKAAPVTHGIKPLGSTTTSSSGISDLTSSESPQPAGPSFRAEEWPSYFEKDDITRTHEMIVDAVTEMLTSGGHQDDVDGLIYATMAHQRRRFFARVDSSPKVDDNVKRFIESDFIEWKTDLMVTWRKNAWPEQPHLEPKSITDRIRANFRECLIGSFDNFMSSASPEEIRLLWSVLNNWDGRHHQPEHGDDEIYIANAFLIEIDRPDLSHVRVPEHLVDRVQKYIDALRAIEGKEVA